VGVQLSKQLEELEGAVRQYHSTGDRLKVLPADAKRAGGLQYELAIHSRAQRAEDMLSADLKNVIKPALTAIKDAYTTKLRSAAPTHSSNGSQGEGWKQLMPHLHEARSRQ
jgi:hypothetical protein